MLVLSDSECLLLYSLPRVKIILMIGWAIKKLDKEIIHYDYFLTKSKLLQKVNTINVHLKFFNLCFINNTAIDFFENYTFRNEKLYNILFQNIICFIKLKSIY